MNRALQEDDALAALYPQLKVTPVDQAVELKRKQQQEMNQYLTKQMQEKAEKQRSEKKNNMLEVRQQNQDYSVRVEKRLEIERNMRRTKNVMCIKECQALINAKKVAKEFAQDNEKLRYATLYNDKTKPLEERPPKFFISPLKAAIGMNYDDFQDGYLTRDVQNYALE